MALITEALENHLFTEATSANLSSSLFQETNKTLIELVIFIHKCNKKKRNLFI